ncbi:MAG TPA: TetR/AcrR family transcriptional regulator [Polyangiaceae bacterium]|nr:TetR/AcrR family transcriptional regulator [Polyangiaceae bacterium]HMR76602.1 TetR/AcrR family transcriptional regulator [Polyangiaceae bacterium]
MPRAAAFSKDEIAAAAVELAAAGGPGNVTMQGVAAAVGAPSGSIYHRFAGRPELLATVWARCLDDFQLFWWDKAGCAQDPGDAAVVTLAWARKRRACAKVLLVNSPREFLSDDTPEAARNVIRELQQRSTERLVELAERFLCRCDTEAVERTVFALATVPMATLRGPLLADAPITRCAEALVRETAACLLSRSRS